LPILCDQVTLNSSIVSYRIVRETCCESIYNSIYTWMDLVRIGLMMTLSVVIMVVWLLEGCVLFSIPETLLIPRGRLYVHCSVILCMFCGILVSLRETWWPSAVISDSVIVPLHYP